MDEIGSLDILIAATYYPCKSVKAQIHGSVPPRRVFHGAETCFRQVAEGDACGWNCGRGRSGRDRQREEALIVEPREIHAEAAEIVCKEDRAAHFGVNGFTERVRERETKCKRGKEVVVRHESPATGEQRLDLQPLLLTTLTTACPIGIEPSAIADTKGAVPARSVLERLGSE